MILLRFGQAYTQQCTKNTKKLNLKKYFINKKKLDRFELPSLAFVVLIILSDRFLFFKPL